MFRFFRKHRSFVMISLAAVILGMLLFGIGGTSMVASVHDTIMKVNGVKVAQIQFDRILTQIQRQPNATSLKPEQMQQMALQEVIRQEVFYQEAKKYGIEITDQELQMQLAGIPIFQKDGRFDPQTYVQVLAQSFQMSPRDFEKTHKKDVAAREMNKLIETSVQISDDQLQEALENRLNTETDPKKKKEIQENPEIFRQELQEKEKSLVLSDWLGQLNSTLKINIVSDTFRKRMGQPAQ